MRGMRKAIADGCCRQGGVDRVGTIHACGARRQAPLHCAAPKRWAPTTVAERRYLSCLKTFEGLRSCVKTERHAPILSRPGAMAFRTHPVSAALFG